MQLGFIGLGVMGRPMALHLMRAGHSMAVYGRRPASTQPLVDTGAKRMESPAALAAECEVIFTMVTDSADVEAIALGPDGIIHGARPGTVLVDMETISPVAAKRIGEKLAERGIEMIDAPVSGGPAGAEQATLSIMAGGKPDVFQRIKPLFEVLGKTIVHMGDAGAGQLTKACNQLVLLVTAEGVAEALNLARNAGVDTAKVREVMLGGIASSRVLDLFGGKMVSRDFQAGIESRLYFKDLAIVLGLAHDMGLATPAAAVTMQHINARIGRGAGSNDLSALLQIVEDMGARRGS